MYLEHRQTSVLLENTPLLESIRNHIRDSSGVFSISPLSKISMISLQLNSLRSCIIDIRCISGVLGGTMRTKMIDTSSGLLQNWQSFKTVLITHYFNPFPISNLIAAGPFREVFNDLITKLIPCGIADQWHSDSLQLVTNLCFETAVLKLKIRIRETPKGDWLKSVLKPSIWWR